MCCLEGCACLLTSAPRTELPVITLVENSDFERFQFNELGVTVIETTDPGNTKDLPWRKLEIKEFNVKCKVSLGACERISGGFTYCSFQRPRILMCGLEVFGLLSVMIPASLLMIVV